MSSISGFMSGALMMGLFCAGLFFIKFWRVSHDRLFAIFAVGFFVLGLERVVLQFFEFQDEARPFVYLMRAFANIAILLAIIDKNMRSKSEVKIGGNIGHGTRKIRVVG